MGPQSAEYPVSNPPMPILPRQERGHRWLRYLAAALLLALVVGGGAFAVARVLDGDDNRDETAQVVGATPESEDIAAPAPTTASQTDAVTPTPPVPTPTAEPETEPVAADPAEPTAADQEENTVAEADAEGEQPTIRTATSLLPDAGELAGVWLITNEGERTEAEVAAQLGADGEQLLTSWRWRENVYRDFTRETPEQFPEETTFLNVSVHRFASAEGAAAATDYLADIVVSAQGLQDVAIDPIGDKVRALAGPGDGVNLYVLYVQDGNYVIRLGGASAVGDPLTEVNSVAETIVAS